jgi:SAM-dependent methyltransferase
VSERSYDVTAEFYDLLHAADYVTTTERLLDRWLGDPIVGVLDVGAGTGIATGLLARRCRVTVHAVEPAASMRAVLLSRLAGRPELLSRIRLHARTVQRLGLQRVADFALCLNTMSGFNQEARAAALDALARALVPGATLVVQRPPSDPGADRYDLPSWYLGGDVYGGDVACTPIGEDLVEWRFTYRITRDDVIVREQVETFQGHLASADNFDAQLTKAGFALIDTDGPDIVIARRIG